MKPIFKSVIPPVLISILIISTLFLGTVNLIGNEMLINLSKKKIDLLNSDFSNQLKEVSSPVEMILKVTAQWGKANLISRNSDSIVSKMKPVLNNLKAVDGLMISDSSDFYIDLRKDGSDWKLTAPDSSYVPISREWFEGAVNSPEGDLFWTKPYRFYSSNRAGITASTKWRESLNSKTSVVAVDILLEDLFNSFEIKSQSGALIVVLNQKNYPVFQLKIKEDGSNSSAKNSNEIIEKALYQHHYPKNWARSVSQFSYGSQKYWSRIDTLSSELGSVQISTIIPETGSLKDMRKAIYTLSIMGTVLILILSALLLLLFKKRFSKAKIAEHFGELNRIFSDSTDMNSFLSNTVTLVASIMKAPVCSIYFFDRKTNSLILKATEGLNRDLVDITKLNYGEGLIGLALKELRPINVNSASSQKSYFAVEGLKEEHYDSLIAVPIIRGLNKIGVLVLQREANKPFNSNNLFVAEKLAQQLTSVLETAGSLLSILDKQILDTPQIDSTITHIRGKVASPGYAFGEVHIEHNSDTLELLKHREWEREFSLADFEWAIAETSLDLEKLQLQVENRLADAASMIFTAHLLMLKDSSFSGAIKKLIKGGINPPIATLHVADDLIHNFAASPSKSLREKVDDIKDLAQRVLEHLSPELASEGNHSGKVIIAKELFPSDILVFAIENVKGIVLVSGGVTSHLAILCRSLNIPLIMTDDNSAFSIEVGTKILLDATHGVAHLNPDSSKISEYEDFEKNCEECSEDFKKGCATSDSTEINLYSNVNLISDAEKASKYNIKGIGLYRSEFPFMIRDSLPTEEEQYTIYKKVADSVKGRELTFRTLDIGGDKVLPYFDSPEEENPFLGMRAIRFLLKEPQIFRAQIRAILRAALDVDLNIMFPMIQSVDEFLEAKAFVLSIRDELISENIKLAKNLKIGMMIEIPAVLPLLDEFAAVADFFSVGTNDLVQYLLAVDRTNASVASLYKPHHPAVLKALAAIAQTAIKFKKPLSICGDMANGEKYIPFLIGCGITKISVHPAFFHRVQTVTATHTLDECRHYAEELLSCSTLEESSRIVARGVN